MTEITGGCACGKVRFRITQPPIGAPVCHCRDCQKFAGGGPNYLLLVPKSGFEVTKGEAKSYHSKADSGAEIRRAFCPDCGAPLWSEPAGVPFLAVKLGALDEPRDYRPTLHLYTESAPPWHLLHEGLPQFPKMPPPGGSRT
jgi:hypothetical protein